MSEMVERVARAIFGDDEQWGRMKDDPRLRAEYEPQARAAIEAMFHPTEAMLEAARVWSADFDWQPIGNAAATGCWQAMHGGALK